VIQRLPAIGAARAGACDHAWFRAGSVVCRGRASGRACHRTCARRVRRIPSTELALVTEARLAALPGAVAPGPRLEASGVMALEGQF